MLISDPVWNEFQLLESILNLNSRICKIMSFIKFLTRILSSDAMHVSHYLVGTVFITVRNIFRFETSYFGRLSMNCINAVILDLIKFLKLV